MTIWHIQLPIITMRILHNYFRSSASYRVRIAMNLKGLPFEYRAVHLNRSGGEQFQPAFRGLNPQQLVPVLDDGVPVSQSMAILEYLEERYPEVPLLPEDADDRAHVRALAFHIACDIHPLNNLRVLKFLSGDMEITETKKKDWIRHWIELGLKGLEESIAASGASGSYCFGSTPTLADCCLIPQMYSARRFDVDLSPYPRLVAIEAACDELDEFRAAHPSCQPDSE